jgi:hypothetical protein
MRHLYHGYVSHNQRKNTKLQPPETGNLSGAFRISRPGPSWANAQKPFPSSWTQSTLPPCAESRQAKRNEDSMPSPGACSSRTNEGCWEVSLRGGEVMAKLRCSRDFTLRNVTFYDVMELNLPIVSEMAKKNMLFLCSTGLYHQFLSDVAQYRSNSSDKQLVKDRGSCTSVLRDGEAGNLRYGRVE